MQVLKRYRDEWPAGNAALTGQDTEFIQVLTRAFEEDVNFRFSEFNAFPIEVLVDYIQRTHWLYIHKTLHEIEQSLSLLNSAYPFGHELLEILNNFYLDYKHDLIHHIREEDDQLIPYVLFLKQTHDRGINQFEFFNRSNRFNIEKFFEQHDESDDLLEKIRKKIMAYDPPPTNGFIYGVLLNQFSLFEHDLKIHGLIEEQVLIPKALDLEQKLMSRFLKGVRLN